MKYPFASTLDLYFEDFSGEDVDYQYVIDFLIDHKEKKNNSFIPNVLRGDDPIIKIDGFLDFDMFNHNANQLSKIISNRNYFIGAWLALKADGQFDVLSTVIEDWFWEFDGSGVKDITQDQFNEFVEFLEEEDLGKLWDILMKSKTFDGISELIDVGNIRKLWLAWFSDSV